MTTVRRIGSLTFVLAAFVPFASACASAPKDQCAMAVDGTSHHLENVVAVRAHDPFDLDDSTRLTRLLCFEKPIPKSTVSNEGELMGWVMREGHQGLVIEVRDNGDVVTAAMLWAGKQTHWTGTFSGFEELKFSGTNDAERIAGTIATEPALKDETAGVSVRFAIQLEHDIDATW